MDDNRVLTDEQLDQVSGGGAAPCGTCTNCGGDLYFVGNTSNRYMKKYRCGRCKAEFITMSRG